MPVDFNIRHIFTPKALFGGGSSVTTGNGVSKAKTTETPKLSSQHKYHGDHVLTRAGKHGALQLGRLAKSMAPKVQAQPQPQNGGNGKVKTAHAKAMAQITPEPPKPQQTTAPKPPFATLLSDLQGKRDDMRSDVDKLRNQQPDPLSTKKEQYKAEVALNAAQTKLKGDVDKTLGEIGKQLSEKTKALETAKAVQSPDQTTLDKIKDLNAEIAQLKEVRREFIAIGITSDFTGLGQDVPKGGAMSEMLALKNGGKDMEHVYVKDKMGEIGRMIDDFNAGTPIAKDDGTVLTPDEFGKYINHVATNIDTLFGSEVSHKATDELRKLPTLINTRSEFSGAVQHFEALLDKFAGLSPPLDPVAFPNGFPLSSAMQVISSAFPHSREFGNSDNIRQLEAAAVSVSYFAEMIGRGETTPALHGVDLKFDKAMLPLKQATGSDIAFAKLREDRAKGPLPSDAMIALLDKADKDLSAKERKDMLDLHGPGNIKTLDEAREILGQAKDEIRLARTIGGDAGVHKLRDERDKGPLPADNLIAACGKDLAALKALLKKTDGNLSDTEKANMLALVGNGKTLADARAVLTDVATAREAGSLAATLRDELTMMDKKLSQLLTVDRSKWYKPWTWGTSIKGAWYTPNKWGSGERVTTTLAGVKIDAQFMKGLHNIGGAGAGKDVAILTARFAHLQQQTVLQEQQALGLHEGYDWNGVPSTGQPYAQIDPNNPLAHIGITNKQLKEIGLSDTDILSVGATVGKLAKQGVGSIQEIRDVTGAINDVAKIVLKSELAHENIVVFESSLARVEGQRLLDDILTDGDMQQRSSNPGLGERDPKKQIKSTDDAVVAHFKDRNDKLKAGLKMDDMRLQSTQYRSVETALGRVYSDHMTIDKELDTRREVLVKAGKDFGVTVDPDDPRGLKSAKHIVTALDAQKIMDDPQSTRSQKYRAKETRDAALQELHGFDTTKMRVPWAKLSKETPTMDTLLDKFSDVATLEARYPDSKPLTDPAKIRELATRDLRSVADAIVYIRETGPMGKVQLEGEIPKLGNSLEDIVASRREGNEAVMAEVTTMVRAAVLEQWQNSKADFNAKGGISEGFDPSDKTNRDKIEATLKGWGMDISAFGPEIDSVLFSRMAPSDIEQWRSETSFSREMIQHIRTDDRPILNLDRLIGRRVMDTETRGVMLGMLEGFQEGDKLDLKAGQRVTLDSGKIPVEPTGLAGIRARLAGAHIGQFEIEMGSDGFKLHVRTGGEVKANVDAVVGQKFGNDHGLGPNLEARVEASAGLEGSGSHLTGFTISFDKGEDGRLALVNLVAKMIDGEKDDPITVKDWQSATDVGHTYEDRGKIGAGIRGDARIAVGGKIDPDKTTSTKMDEEFLGVGVSAGISAGVALGGKQVGTDSHNQVTRKGEIEVSTSFNVNTGVYAQFYNLMNMTTGAMVGQGGQAKVDEHFQKDENGKSNYNITSNTAYQDLVNLGVTASASAVRKWKLQTTPDGQYTGAEKVRQSTGSSGPIASFASCLHGAQMEKLLKSDKPAHKEFAKDLETFMKLKGPNDQIAVKFAPKPEILDQANGLVARAIAAEKTGTKESLALAGMYRAKAEKLMLDDNSYFPKEIGLITTDVQKREDSNINARWIRWDTFSDGKTEHRGVVLGIPQM